MHSLASPQPGERTLVTIAFGPADELSFEGDVLYVERSIGFAVKFHDVDAQRQADLQRRLESFAKASA